MSLLKVMYLMQRGLSVTRAVDYAVVEEEGIPAEDWATVRDVTPKAVRNSLREVEEVVGDEQDDEADEEPVPEQAGQQEIPR